LSAVSTTVVLNTERLKSIGMVYKLVCRNILFAVKVSI
jgi:hypothetical protein